jgi:membrane protein DedA with SNARE-associated domain
LGVLASQGHYSAVTVIAVAAAAATVGDNLGFWLIGRRGGRALIARSAWLERRAQHVLPRAEALIDRYGGRAVFFGRFVAILRETIAWVAGLVGMSWPHISLVGRPARLSLPGWEPRARGDFERTSSGDR